MFCQSGNSSNSNKMMMILYIFSTAFFSAPAVTGFVASGTTTIRRIHTHCPFLKTTKLAVKQSPLNDIDENKTIKSDYSSSPSKDETNPSFDPFGLSSTSSSSSSPNDPTAIKVLLASSSLEHQTVDGKEEPEMGIWAARGILLFVAAIWGTNFAVRLIFAYLL